MMTPILSILICRRDARGFTSTQRRAIARSSGVKTGVDPIQHGVIPSGSHTFAANVVFDSSVKAVANPLLAPKASPERLAAFFSER